MLVNKESVVEIKKELVDFVDGHLPNHALISIVPGSLYGVNIVIGARYGYEERSYFSKYDLSQLIKILQEVHDNMK